MRRVSEGSPELREARSTGLLGDEAGNPSLMIEVAGAERREIGAKRVILGVERTVPKKRTIWEQKLQIFSATARVKVVIEQGRRTKRTAAFYSDATTTQNQSHIVPPFPRKKKFYDQVG
ncbi:hypothetical protein CRG98_015221 [Punica granatum]|uniref:Uncharacterized protein n=1 Tax=Punica granatum TaxID=22663 RepID=A0A2I0K726_PUNGR|nr:hypothetical protein CRG98_015221 [Punica granatum]